MRSSRWAFSARFTLLRARSFDALGEFQGHCDELTLMHGGRVAFSVRQLGGVSAGGKRQQRQQLWLDMRFADPAPGHVRDNLYELQAPLSRNELPPTRPHSPPTFGSDSSEDEARGDDLRLLT